MNTAEKVIEKFGGQSKLAKLIERRQSTVQYWAKSGIIPAQWQGELLLLAKRLHIDLGYEDLIGLPRQETRTHDKSLDDADRDFTRRASPRYESRFSYQRLETPGRFSKGSFTIMFIDFITFTRYGDNQDLRRGARTLQNGIIDVFDELEWDVAGPVTQNDAVMIPTGDGYWIGFENFVDDKDILNYAARLSTRLKEENTSVRIGINHGPCFVHRDVNSRVNLVGWGLVDAERVMTCGSKGHILCTSAFARPLIDSTDEPNLHFIGQYSIRGRKLEVYNYYSDSFGNPYSPPEVKMKGKRKRNL